VNIPHHPVNKIRTTPAKWGSDMMICILNGLRVRAGVIVQSFADLWSSAFM